MAHEHGAHSCYCPTCGYQTTVAEYVKCNTQSCPVCGDRLRAVETGEYRSSLTAYPSPDPRYTRVSTSVGSVACPVCGYPIPDPRYLGEQVKCAYCGTISEAISQVSIPSSLFAGVIGFVVGVILGPTVIAAAEAGSQKLARKSRERLS
jgi:uncharacterized protein (DUF983 family)